VKRAKPYSQGKIKMPVVLEARYARQLVELTQRMNPGYDAGYSRHRLLPKNDVMIRGVNAPKDEEEILRAYLNAGGHDVFTGNFATLVGISADTRRRLAERVAEGMGVVVFPTSRKDLGKLLPDASKRSEPDSTPLFSFADRRLTGVVGRNDKIKTENARVLLKYKGAPLVLGLKYGKGNVVLINAGSAFCEMLTRANPIAGIPDARHVLLDAWQEYPDEEYAYMLLARCLLWASGRMGPTRLDVQGMDALVRGKKSSLPQPSQTRAAHPCAERSATHSATIYTRSRRGARRPLSRAPKGAWDAAWPVAFDEMKGTWRVRVIDVLSDAAEEVAFVIVEK